ncbi:DUF6745 domain-containing protein [Brevundimonas olei]|uniref:DUF6745 domain-containing protein n=1 Tax=Brevundimonas olei TaxID=657642 RepID=UPI0031E0E13B
MAAKLDLTPERSAIIQQVYADHLKIGLCTAPADFDAAEAAIERLYASIGKKRPYFVRLSSPLGAELYINLLCKTWPEIDRGQLWDQLGGQLWDQLGGQLWDQLRDQLGDQLRDQLGGQLGGQLWDQLGGQLWDQLRDQLGDQLRDQLGGQLGGQLWDQLRGQLRDQLGGQLRGQLWDQLRDQLGDQLGGQLGDQLRGQLWKSKLSFMGTWFWGQWDYLWAWLDGGRRVGAVYPDKLNASLDDHLIVCRSIGWWYPFNDFCILTDRPEHLSRDAEGRLHNETGASLRYRDGTGLHAWHGTRVPAHWIEQKDSVDPSEIIKAANVEQRAAGAAILGWPRMLSVLKARVINDSGSPDIGQLIELNLPGLREPGRFLKAECPRNGTIVEGVPRVSDIDGLPIETALHAQAWRIGDPLSEYQHPAVRT